MTWLGYYVFDGVEVINTTRFEDYAKEAGWFRPVYRAGGLAPGLGAYYDVSAYPQDISDPGTWSNLVGDVLEEDDDDEGTYLILRPEVFAEDPDDPGTYLIPSTRTWGYQNPVVDDAPWYDADVPESADFYGCYPVSIVGMEDSSQGSTITESTKDGGIPGRIRFSTKEVVFSVLVGGASEAAAEYGLKWLNRVLLGQGADDTRTQGLGYEVRYLASQPPVTDPDGDGSPDVVLTQFNRTRRRAVVTRGPAKTSGRDRLSCGGSVWSVQFTVTFGDPFEYTDEREVLDGLFDPETADPFPSLVSGSVDTTHTYLNEDCVEALWLPLYDPLCPAVIAPPTVPNVPLGCWATPTEWQRTVVRFDGSSFPTWLDTLPVVNIRNASGDPFRGLRLRWYTDDTGTFDPDTDPCGWLTDIVVSYLPPSSVMRIDATTETVLVSTGPVVRRADSVIFDSNGEPVSWPIFTGGGAYLLVVDYPSDSVGDVPSISASLVNRTS